MSLARHTTAVSFKPGTPIPGPHRMTLLALLREHWARASAKGKAMESLTPGLLLVDAEAIAARLDAELDGATVRASKHHRGAVIHIGPATAP